MNDMKTVLTIIFIITLISCNSNKNLTIKRQYPLIETSELIGSIEETEEAFIFKIKNNSLNVKYLLSSYIDNRFSYNPNLFTKKEEGFIIYYLPILTGLGTVKSDVLIVDDASVLKQKQAIYTFMDIAPNKEVEFSLQKEKLNKLDYKGLDNIVILLAIYDDVSLLKVKGTDYEKSLQESFVKQAKNYKILIIKSD